MRTFRRIIGIPGVSNLGEVLSGKIYRSGQPEFLAGIEALGIRSILNLQMSASFEESVPSAIRQIPFRINVFSEINRDQFDLLIQELRDPANQPILVHCRQGHDRTGVVCGAYRMKVDGWTYEEAEEEMIAYGFNPLWQGLKSQLKHYADSL